jgi:hypothetical protein
MLDSNGRPDALENSHCFETRLVPLPAESCATKTDPVCIGPFLPKEYPTSQRASDSDRPFSAILASFKSIYFLRQVMETARWLGLLGGSIVLISLSTPGTAEAHDLFHCPGYFYAYAYYFGSQNPGGVVTQAGHIPGCVRNSDQAKNQPIKL